MGLLPQDEYVRIVLGTKQLARELTKFDDLSVRAIGVRIGEDMDVLIQNLKDNGVLMDIDNGS